MDEKQEKGPTPDVLKDAIRRVRLADVERTSATADLRSIAQTRLEILQDALVPVLANVPDDVRLFDAGLVRGEHPRLFIDILAYVDMAPDLRTYRFVQDTRWGQTNLVESADFNVVFRMITDYIAQRLIEREKALASDTVRSHSPASVPPAPPPSTPLPVEVPARRSIAVTLLLLLAGAILGAGLFALGQAILATGLTGG